MIARGRITAARTRGGRVLLDVALTTGEQRSRIEYLQPTGFSAVPVVGTDVVVLGVGGRRDHLLALCADDRALRLTGLVPGEFGFRDARGQSVVFRDDGVEIAGALKVTITASGPVSIESGGAVDLEATGTVTVTAPTIKLGSSAASSPVMLASGPATKILGE